MRLRNLQREARGHGRRIEAAAKPTKPRRAKPEPEKVVLAELPPVVIPERPGNKGGNPWSGKADVARRDT